VRTDGALRLISVGRLSAEKRPDIAIGALAELIRRGVHAELTLIGSGPWEKRLRRRASHLPVRFVGHEPDADAVAAQLACSDIALSPGPAETFGLATLEALACGTAAVVVAGAATSETIGGDDHVGRAVSLHPVAFADAILSLLTIPAQIRRAAATAAAENYRWSRTVAAMMEIHGELSGTDRLVAVGEDTA
jgi:alpha-1,6-mannosyltransferase